MTHFLSLPLIYPEFKKSVKELQDKILSIYDEEERKKLHINSPDLMHITLGLLSLEDEKKKEKSIELFEKIQEEINEFLSDKKVKINLGGLEFFGYNPKKYQQESSKIEQKPKLEEKSKNEEESKNEEKACQGEKEPVQIRKSNGVIFLDVIEDENIEYLRRIANFWIKKWIDHRVINIEDIEDLCLKHDKDKNIFYHSKYHITLFRFDSDLDIPKLIEAFKDLKFGEAYPETVEFSIMGTVDDNKFYKHLKKHKL